MNTDARRSTPQAEQRLTGTSASPSALPGFSPNQSEDNRRRHALGAPGVEGSGITRRRFLAGTGVILTGPAFLASCGTTRADRGEAQPAITTRVHFRLVDAQTGKTTPAMACITDAKSSEVRLPPDGRVCAKPTSVQEFVAGVSFNADRNWIGPVRKMQGKGDNNDRSFVYQNRPSIPYWKEPMIYQTSGDFLIDLPAGRWRIGASHGMEYVPVAEEFEVNGRGEMEKTLLFTRWIDLPTRGWWSGDVHVHHPSADPAQREFLMQYALAEDVHVVNLLEMGDHAGTTFSQAGFGKKFRVQRGDFALVSGQEDPRSTFGHIIGLNLQAMVRDTATYDFYDLTFRGIHAQPDALVGFAHFAWNGCDLPRGFPWFVTTGEIDFIEVLQFGMLNRLDYAEYLNLGFRLTAAAGSDTPWGSTIGEVRTYVHMEKKFDVDNWFRDFKAGRTFVSNGPALEFTVDGELPGAELTRSPGARVKIRARALGQARIGLPTVLQVEGPAGIVKEIKGNQGETVLEFEIEHSVEASQWLMASVVCDNNAVAHTTPIYVVVNAQPTWNPRQGPGVIEQQLAAIAKIESEVAKGNDARSAGIRERLNKAKAFYASLREKMSKASS